MRMIVWIMVIPHPVNIGPGVDLPVYGVVDTNIFQVIDHRFIDLRAKPIGTWTVVFQWIVFTVIRGQAFIGLFHFANMFDQVAVGFFKGGQRALHKFGWKKVDEFSHAQDIARIDRDVRILIFKCYGRARGRGVTATYTRQFEKP